MYDRKKINFVDMVGTGNSLSNKLLHLERTKRRHPSPSKFNYISHNERKGRCSWGRFCRFRHSPRKKIPFVNSLLENFIVILLLAWPTSTLESTLCMRLSGIVVCCGFLNNIVLIFTFIHSNFMNPASLNLILHFNL